MRQGERSSAQKVSLAAGQPACPQVGRCIGLPASDRKYPALTGRSGTQWARGGHAHGSGGRLSKLSNLCLLPARTHLVVLPLTGRSGTQRARASSSRTSGAAGRWSAIPANAGWAVARACCCQGALLYVAAGPARGPSRCPTGEVRGTPARRFRPYLAPSGPAAMPVRRPSPPSD